MDSLTPFNYKRDARKSHKPGLRDHCQTPPYAILPLLQFLPRDCVIWEPAMGEGLLAQSLKAKGFKVITTDNDFFDYEPDNYNIIITNPPFSLSQKWMQRCFELDKPWALLLKSEIIANQGIQKLFRKYGNPEMVYPESRINFKMPLKGWATGAQFNTHWYTFGLNIGRPHTWLCPINKEKKEFHLKTKQEEKDRELIERTKRILRERDASLG